VSDQDFFFDEDEKPAAKSQSKGSASKGNASPAKSGRPAAKNAAPAQQQSVTYTVAALVGVAALLLGVIIGILLPINVGSATTATPDAGLTGTSGQTQAPALTNEQMQSGQLPAGHPSIGGSSGATGSATTTP
jgi:hypothetical protein